MAISSNPLFAETKKMPSIRGISRINCPTVVLAMGFAVGTSADDIMKALVPAEATMSTETSEEATVESPASPSRNNPTYCHIISTGPKVIAKLTYRDKATAEGIVATWHGAEVDGGKLELWVTDDAPHWATTFKECPSKSVSGNASTNVTFGSPASIVNAGNAFGTPQPSLDPAKRDFGNSDSSHSSLLGQSNGFNSSTKPPTSFSGFSTSTNNATSTANSLDSQSKPIFGAK